MIFSLLPLQHTLPASRTTIASADTPGTWFAPFIVRESSPVLTGAGDWPMAGSNPQRTSWTATEVKGSLKPEWYKHFDAYISQKVQIIATANKLFISAADGLHALDSNSGEEQWFFPTRLPPGNAPTISGGVAYLGGLDGNLYAIDAASGRELWHYAAGGGFETNPLVVNNTVYLGNRNGYFYAIRSDGLAWRYATKGSILVSAAYKDGVLYFASNDMYAYALDAGDGSLVWKSGKLPGMGFHSWWPVVYENYVVFAGSWPYRFSAPFGNATHTILDRGAYATGSADGSTIGATGTTAGDWASGTVTMNASRISQYFEAYPQRRSTVVLSLSSGKEYTYDSDRDGRPEYAPFLYQGTYSGNRYPPAVGKDGVLYQANNYIYNSAIPRGQVTGWKFGTSTISIPTSSTNAVDEPLSYAIGGDTVYWKRCCDRSAGSFSLLTRSGSQFYDEGGMRLRRTLPDLFNEGWDFAYWKHGDTTPPIPYNGRVYLISNNAVVALSSKGLQPTLPLDEAKGSSTGVAASQIERGTNIVGLNTKVTFGSATWPLLYQQERYYELKEQTDVRAAHFRMFEVAGAASGNPSANKLTSNSTNFSVASTFGSQTLTTNISKRAPGILFENTGSTYLLRGSVAGVAYPTSSGVQVRTGSATISGSSLSESWLLVWDGTAQHRWMPVVISLFNRPSQVTFDANGVTLTYSGAAGAMGVTPLYGMAAPKSSEETSWRTRVPAATVDRVKMMNYLIRAFPTSGTESQAIDNASGDVTLSYSYQYKTLSDAWNTGAVQLAYLPTSLALAAWNGSPIRVDGRVPSDALTDISFVTPIGRVAGLPNTTSVQVTLPGLANYWRRIPAAPGAPAQGDALQARLVEEVQKILDAGHLLPGYGAHGMWDSRANNRIGPNLPDYWHNPAETVYTLIRAVPLLPASMQDQVRAYLTREFNAYPTYSVTHVGWATGASRQAFDFAPEVQSERASEGSCGECTAWGITPENHYASWMYASTIASASTITTIYNNTNSKLPASPQFPQSLSYSLNSHIAGYIGYLRLASLANAGAKPDQEKTLVNLLVLRAALSKYPSALEGTGFEYGGYKWAMRTYAPNMPDTMFVLRTMGTNWSQTPLYGFQKDLIYGMSGPGTGGAYFFGIDYVNLVPEVGSFMRAYVLNEERAAIADYQRRAPYWFVANAEEGAGEGVIRPIYETIAIFQARAWILDDSRSTLVQYLDVPVVPVGDLYYIQKLIIALEKGS